jgi:hypothetical protein
MALSVPPVDEAPRAIETRYKGYRFRSRLEARWAVFFDTLGVRWEYEKEGFDLGPAGWYLPDFWLPDLEVWLEVKGVWARERDDVWIKACALALESAHKVYVFAGQLEHPNAVVGYQFWGTEDETTGHGPLAEWWFRCPACGKWQLGRTVSELPCECLDYSPAHQPALVAAIDAAKSARFEFGEHG